VGARGPLPLGRGVEAAALAGRTAGLLVGDVGDLGHHELGDDPVDRPLVVAHGAVEQGLLGRGTALAGQELQLA
jgi:hypothetical protein